MSTPMTAAERRTLFRRAVTRLDGSADPQAAFSNGMYLPRPDSIAERLAASIDLRPRGTHLVVGSVGSGKTSMLLEVQRRLEEIDDIACAYYDVANHPEAWDDEDIERLCHQVMKEGKKNTFLIDGLDRQDPGYFKRDLQKVLQDFEGWGWGLVCVGPPTLVTEPPSFESDWFDATHVCGAVDPHSEGGAAFLMEVIASRAGGIFTTQAQAELREKCGGLLRDLLLIARQATENAYLTGENSVDASQVSTAARQLGQGLLRGVDSNELALLHHYQESKSAIPQVDLQRFVLHRWLIPTGSAPVRYRIHPCIEPLLVQAA